MIYFCFVAFCIPVVDLSIFLYDNLYARVPSLPSWESYTMPCNLYHSLVRIYNTRLV